ncbi:DUF1810 domain-containing protein [Pannus brasiliensis CCIBt3594]|uniref:DUF1810 domain-containing protein n=1 Tax=Pannus brasiliensis CCIBt3594 TaxID=1427578 RepID=A0AAW9R0R4_9CHRO
MSDTYDLQRFVEAQEFIYAEVIRELKRGYKQSHWMWYIFPQIKGLGRSETARKFALGSLEEAREYLKHPVLGERLRECIRLVLAVEGRTSEQIFGSIDTLKFRSSMTLFLYATEDNRIFQEALEKYFDGQSDRLTVNLLKKDEL